MTRLYSQKNKASERIFIGGVERMYKSTLGQKMGYNAYGPLARDRGS